MFELRDYQKNAIETCYKYMTGKSRKPGVCVAPTGCHAAGTLIRMANYSTKRVENILCGDMLMGEDGNPKKVLKTHFGTGRMYRITLEYGYTFEVNEDHIFPLYVVGENRIENTSLSEYLMMSESEKDKRRIIKIKDVKRLKMEFLKFKYYRLNKDYYYGFELDGNHLYVDSEWIVHHNSGKSLLIGKLSQMLEKPTLVLQPSKEILIQNYNKAVSFGAEPTIYSASCNKKELSNLIYATIGSIKKEVDALKEIGIRYILIDECFTGDTEILTENGFVRFDELKEDLKVAQFNTDDGKIYFVNPLRYIKKYYKGDMVNIKIYRDVWMPVTENHEILTRSIILNQYKKEKAKYVKFGNHKRIPSCGESGIESDFGLDPMERLYIAIQADGHIHSKSPDHITISFSLSKNRKIKRLYELCEMANVRIWEVCLKVKNKKSRRFMVNMPIGTTKDIRNHINYPMSCEKAKEIVEELVKWDGSIINDHLYYYSSTNESQADFFQAVSVIAGYSCYKTKQIDDRKKEYNDVYRLFIDKSKKEYNTQRYKKNKFKFEGYVYCVEVGSGNIMVRHNGVPIVTGNCNSGYSPDEKSEFMKFIYQFHDLSVMGFTATPCRLHTYGSMTEGNYSMLNLLTKDIPRYFERMVYVIQIQEMIQNGFWAKIDYEVWDFDETNLILNSTGSEYTSDSILMSIAVNGVNNTIYKRIKMILESHEREHILVCMDSVENAYRMRDFINMKHGNISEVVDGKTPKKKRDEIIEDFKAGKIKVVINYATLVIGFDFPELDCVIFGRPTFSFSIYYQVIGRCVRPHKNKKSALFVDCCNNFKRFGAVENVTIENVPYNGWTMFSGDKVISNIRMGDIVTRRMLEMKAEKKIMANMARGVQNSDSVSDGNFVLRFGQHKGKKLCEVPVNYMKFLLEKCLDMAGYDKVARFYKFVTGLPAPQQTSGGER